MKAVTLTLLLASLASAHYAPKGLIIDGVNYFSRDARIDDWVGAKRIEWSFLDNQNFTWMALNDVTAEGIACGNSATSPPIKAFARAGADVTIQWTDVPNHHLGPSMTYMGAWTPGQSPNSVNFFKIAHIGYDTTKKLWGNQIVIANGQKQQFKIPSDIAPGLYILRTELLSLHGNGQYNNPGLKGLPQFYTHCFNIEVTSSGTAIPVGVKFPGGYPKNDPGVGFILGTVSQYASYPIPGPKVYDGRYDAPTGTAATVTAEQAGITFSAAFETKYEALRTKFNAWSDKAVAFFDSGTGGTSFITTHTTEATGLIAERQSLRAEAISLGYADPNAVMQNSQIF